MRTRSCLTIFAIAVLVTAAAPVLAQGPGGQRPPRGGPGHAFGPPDPVIGMAGQALHALELDYDQREQIREIVHAYIEEGFGEMVRTLDEARRELERLVWDPAADEQELINAQQIVADAAEQVELARKALTPEILDVLTDDQRELFLQLLAAEPQDPVGPGGQSGLGGGEGRRGPAPQYR